MKLRLAAAICLLAVFLTACGGAESPTEAPTETAAPTESTYILTDLALVNNETCAFTLTGTEFNEHLGLQIRVLCENKTDRPLTFSWNNTSVCGFVYEPFWAEEVAGGKQVHSTVEIDTYALERMGVPAVDEITFTLSVQDSEEFLEEPAVDQTFTVYPTGKSPDQIQYPQYRHKPEETVIVSGDVLTFIIENADQSLRDLYTLNCYMANHTDRNLMVTWEDVAVNGFEVDPYWAAVIPAGKQAYTQIIFYRGDLQERDIEVVQDVEFTLQAADYEDWTSGYLLEEVYTYTPKQ